MLRLVFLTMLIAGSCVVANAQWQVPVAEEAYAAASAAARAAWRAYNSPEAVRARMVSAQQAAVRAEAQWREQQARWREQQGRYQAGMEAYQRYQRAWAQSMYADGRLAQSRSLNRSPNEIQALSNAAAQARMHLARAQAAVNINAEQGSRAGVVVGYRAPSTPTRGQWLRRSDGDSAADRQREANANRDNALRQMQEGGRAIESAVQSGRSTRSLVDAQMRNVDNYVNSVREASRVRRENEAGNSQSGSNSGGRTENRSTPSEPKETWQDRQRAWADRH